MNKQEFINGLSCLRYHNPAGERYKGYNKGMDIAISMAKKLDESEKPVVPQFVSDWYEEHKDNFELNLYDLCIDFHKRELLGDLYEWFSNNNNNPIETLVKMKLYDYEVEKEKLYTVELPNPNEPDSGHIVLQKDNHNKVYIDLHYVDNWRKLRGVQLTEAEIRENFDWAWQFAEEVEE